MTTQTIEEKICIESVCLGPQIKKHIYQRLHDKMVGKCNQEYGYILSISDKIKIIDNSLAPAGSGVLFNVKFDIESLKPVENEKYKGKVCMILQHGIFVEVADKLKILIPSDKMNNYKYSKNKKLWKKDGNYINLNDYVTITINLIKYEKKNFNCIGTLVSG